MSIDKCKLRIAVDGGAATGKSTISRLVAKKLGIKYINTGQMYRLFAFVSIKNNSLNDEKTLFNFLKKQNITFDEKGNIHSEKIKFNLKDLEQEAISKKSSIIASMPLIRSLATEIQIKIGKEKGVLLEGRDIGTVIMPDADFKFFIKVKPEIAAKRRFDQLKNIKDVSYESILEEIKKRNLRDENRKIAPLKPLKDSIIIDSSYQSIDEIVDFFIKEIESAK
ncbi:MAG: cytidylate kinase [Candidatus Tyloplasma litorale]|nr:MAG: cytidylate kinase [Mycoplasmatales bacterium]